MRSSRGAIMGRRSERRNDDQLRTMLAQEAARAVIKVDDFSREEIEGYGEPAFRPAANDRI